MKIWRAISRTARDERGSFSVEAILMFPMLVWAFMAMFVFFEGLRESNINLKATYTISDLLSRETDLIDQTYLDGMNNIYAWLSRSANPVCSVSPWPVCRKGSMFSCAITVIWTVAGTTRFRSK